MVENQEAEMVMRPQLNRALPSKRDPNMSLYNLRTTELGYRITKFDGDLNIESSYEMYNHSGNFVCTCPAAQRPTCRHRQMIDELLPKVDRGFFYNYDHKTWVFMAAFEPEVAESEPHSQEVKAEDFDSSIAGSNPAGAAIRRRF
jgi:hypothetical protein